MKNIKNKIRNALVIVFVIALLGMIFLVVYGTEQGWHR